MNYIWQPQYVEKFQCQGDKCEAKCCKYWKIEIDDVSLKRYKELQNRDNRDKIISSIVYKDNGFIIKHNDKGVCPLICDDNMCYIQRNFGEDYLSETCTIYPRHLIVLDDVPMHLLSMSCPLALEEVVFDRNGMILERRDNQNINKAWKAEYERNRDNFKINSDNRVEECVIIGSVCILQNKNYNWEERLILLGLFLDRAEEIVSLKKADIALSDLLEIYLSEDFRKEAEKIFSSFVYDEIIGRKII